MTTSEILQTLPYAEPFLFVDELETVTAEHSKGRFRYRQDLEFFRGHFPGEPVVPGVVLTETMAQIGVVPIGIFLHSASGISTPFKIALTSTKVDFYRPVFPGETVQVKSEKRAFRFGKLYCRVEMKNKDEDLVCRGEISGMMRDYK